MKIASFPLKQVKVYWLARMGQNFDQAKQENTFLTQTKHFAPECRGREVAQKMAISLALCTENVLM